MGIFGFLARLSNTFFIDNENKKKIIEYNHLIQKKLQEGENFIIFPEGTTSDGNGIIDFKSSMLECAFDDNNKIKIKKKTITCQIKSVLKFLLIKLKFLLSS